MRRLAIVGTLLACCTVVAAQEQAGTSDKSAQQSGNWFTRMWSMGEKPAPKKADTSEKNAKSTSSEDSDHERFAREETALSRRNQVIIKLREIAVRTRDDDLLRKADDLEQRAWELYQARTSSLNGSGPGNLGKDKSYTTWGEKR